ncbi:hypothetical protein TeGR_g15013, partial [Tetraparma gracilis]
KFLSSFSSPPALSPPPVPRSLCSSLSSSIRSDSPARFLQLTARAPAARTGRFFAAPLPGTLCLAAGANAAGVVAAILPLLPRGSLGDAPGSPLLAPFFACAAGAAPCLALLLASGLFDPLAQAPCGRSLLHCACEAGSAAALELLLAVPALAEPAALASLDASGLSPLHLCAAHGSAACAALLLALPGGRLLAAQPLGGRALPGLTALHLAAALGGASGDAKLIPLLAAAAPMLANDQANRLSLSALHLAACGAPLAPAAALARAGANPAAKDRAGSTPLHVACGAPGARSGAPMVALLLQHGADCGTHDDLGRTALSVAAGAGDGGAAALLWRTGQERGAGSAGVALGEAARNGRGGALAALLRGGALGLDPGPAKAALASAARGATAALAESYFRPSADTAAATAVAKMLQAAEKGVCREAAAARVLPGADLAGARAVREGVLRVQGAGNDPDPLALRILSFCGLGHFGRPVRAGGRAGSRPASPQAGEPAGPKRSAPVSSTPSPAGSDDDDTASEGAPGEDEAFAAPKPVKRARRVSKEGGGVWTVPIGTVPIGN